MHHSMNNNWKSETFLPLCTLCFAVAKCWYNHEVIQLLISGGRRRGHSHRWYGTKKNKWIMSRRRTSSWISFFQRKKKQVNEIPSQNTYYFSDFVGQNFNITCSRMLLVEAKTRLALCTATYKTCLAFFILLCVCMHVCQSVLRQLHVSHAKPVMAQFLWMWI